MLFKNCYPFSDYIIERNNTEISNIKDLDIAIQMHISDSSTIADSEPHQFKTWYSEATANSTTTFGIAVEIEIALQLLLT